MKIQLQPRWKAYQTWCYFFILILIIGIFFRCANLDKKIYWKDETATSLRIAGYTNTEIVKQVANGQVIGIADLQHYQHPNFEKSLSDTIQSLAVDEPQHPPLYFTMARYWVQWFGSSVATIRSLSALLSLLVFPCLYWFCIELFKSPLVAWLAIALIAVSPFHVLYAQEAREYGLWTATILLSSAALLQALRLKTGLSWVIYAATVVLGLYSFLLSGLINIGHGIYVIVTTSGYLSFQQKDNNTKDNFVGQASSLPLVEGRLEACPTRDINPNFSLVRKNHIKNLICYILASVAGLIAFMPWLLAVINNHNKTQDTIEWLTKDTSLLSLINRWIGNLSRIFLDLGFDSRDSFVKVVPLIPFMLILLILTGYAIYFVCSHASQKTWLFILILISLPCLPFVIPDLIWGGQRSGIPRYLIPCYLGVELAVAYLLATQMTSIAAIRKQQLWRLATVALISSGILSCIISSQSQVWWNKGSAEDLYIPKIAHIINQAKKPLLISDGSLGNILALSYLLDKKVRFQLVEIPNIPAIPKEFNEIFLYNSSENLRHKIEKNQSRLLKSTPELGKFQELLWHSVSPK